MGRIGHGYGSEHHLLRFLGRHRHELDRRVLEVVGGESIDWLDFHFDLGKDTWADAEWKGFEFITDNDNLQAAWSEFWPQTGSAQNWDAVARLRRAGRNEWLLVEAKAHTAELQSDCGARGRSREKILEALNETKAALSVPADKLWDIVYYQYCNRLATLYFLRKHGVPGRLLLIYFTGDKGDQRRVCPADPVGWREAIDAQNAAVGLPTGHPLEDHIHKLFLEVKGVKP